MPDVSFTIRMDPANFSREDIAETVNEQIHKAAPQLGNALEEMVRAKTPILSGALQESATYEVGDNQSKTIVEVFYDTDIQVQEYGRDYDKYQEGPPLGKTTYTNNPHNMLQSTADGDGLVYLEVWAREQVQIAVDRVAGGTGIVVPKKVP